MPTLVWRVRSKNGDGAAGGDSARKAAAAAAAAPVSDPVVSASAAVPDSVIYSVASASSKQFDGGGKKRKRRRKTNRAEADTAARKRAKATSERDLPTGVERRSSGKFRSIIDWNHKIRHIGTFDTPEQASAAFISVRKDREDSKLSAPGADDVDALFDAAKKKAVEAVGGTNKARSGRPTGVKRSSSRKFRADIQWIGKKRYIGRFDTPEQASAAHVAVKKDLCGANLSKLGADETNALFDAAKKKAVEAAGGVVSKKQSERDLPRGVYKSSSGSFESRIQLGGKARHIATFATPEQASAAFMSVRKDLDDANLPRKVSEIVARAVFDAAKKQALETVKAMIEESDGCDDECLVPV